MPPAPRAEARGPGARGYLNRDFGAEAITPVAQRWFTVTPHGTKVEDLIVPIVRVRSPAAPALAVQTRTWIRHVVSRAGGCYRLASGDPMSRPLVLFVDIDDTLVRSFGSKRVPMTPVIERVRALHAEGAALYAWSSGGADYARSTAVELGLAACFVAYLPKPDVFVDDVRVESWRDNVQLHPNEVAHRSLDDLRALVAAPPDQR